MLTEQVVISRYGAANVLKIVENHKQRINPDKVGIQVLRAGVAYGDIMARKGVFPFQRGKTPGFDIVGRIVDVGANVKGWEIGEIVAALTISNGYSSYLLLPAKELIRVPPGVNLEQVSAVLLNYTTAYQILKRHCPVKPGSKVFVQGLSGGLGHAFLDLKSEFGIDLYGTASAANMAWVRARGGIPFDYKKGYAGLFHSLVPAGADLVVDGIGGKNFTLSSSLLQPKGQLVGIGYGGNTLGGFVASLLNLFAINLLGRGRKASFYSIVLQKSSAPAELRTDIAYLLALLQQGKINPYIDRMFDFKQVAEAHTFLEGGSRRGKVVLCFSDTEPASSTSHKKNGLLQ